MSDAASVAATERDFEDRVTLRRLQRIKGVGQDGVLWLAVVPAWTEEAAVAVGYPSGDKPLADFVGQAEKAGLCVRSQSSSPDLAALLRVRALAIGSPEDSADQALAAARQIHDERRRAQALIELVGWLPDRLFGPAVAHARSLSPALRARVLAAMVDRRFPSAAPDLPAEAVAAAEQAAPAVRLQVLIQLAPVLPASLRNRVLPELLTALEEADDPLQEADLFGRLAPVLGPADLSRALAAASRIADPAARASSLAFLAAWFPGDQQLTVLAEAAATLVHQPEMRDLVQALVAEGFVRAGNSQRAGAIARRIADLPARATLLGELAVAVARQGRSDEMEDLVGEAVDVLAAVPPARSTVVLAEIAVNLAQAGVGPAAVKLMEDAQRLARDLSSSADNLNALVSLAQTLTAFGSADAAAGVSSRAYQVARQLGDGAQRCDALLAVLPLLPLTSRQAAVDDARLSTHSIPDPRERLRQLINLGKLISGPERQSVAREALTVADRAATEYTFWMPDGVRPGVLRALHDDLGSAGLLATVARIGSQIGSARRDAGISLSDALAKWAELAVRASEGPTATARWLGTVIDAALARRDVPEAMAWVTAGQTMADLLGEELDVMARFGSRRLELLQRQVHDDRQVAHFMKRDRQVAAFTDLLDASDTEPWALHYIGMGGVGKTMLLRYLTARVAPERRAATCRVDFDHLSPDYPVRRPGQLLIELMSELQTYASTGQERTVADFQDRIVHLHEVTSATEVTAEFQSGVDRPEFQGVLRSFCDFVNSLDRRVVLILDTCEELAKIPPVAGVAAVGVVETFKLLRAIKKAAPAVRVVFAGRRLLARSGHGWRIADDAPAYSALMPEHDEDLRLQEIRGFEEQEAHAFLTVIKGLTSLSPDVERAILGQSPDAGTAAEITWTDPGEALANGPADQPRFNPFDLSMLADWVRETGASSPDAIRSADTDLYIERRIMGRLASVETRLLPATETADAASRPLASRQEIERVMPAVVLLRRFDRAMLRPSHPDSDTTFEAVYQALIGQEWIDVQTDERLGTTFLEVDRNLYPRLRAYFEEYRRRAQLVQAARLLGPQLRDQILERNPWEVPYEAINAALELLPPADASALWDEIGVRVARDGRWDWAESVPGRLLAEDGAVSALDSPLRAAVRATHLAGLQHRWPDADVAGGWQEVRNTHDLEVDPRVRDWLRARATVAGHIAASADGDWRSLLGTWSGADTGTDALARYRREQLAAALVSAIEASLERFESGSEPVMSPPASDACLAWVAGLGAAQISPQLRAFAHVLAGRARALNGDRSGAEGQLRQAGRLIADESGPQQAWFDWRAPDSLHDRVELERLRFWSPLLGAAPEGYLTRLPDSPSPDTIDAERLVSAQLELRLGRAPVSEGELDRLTVLDGRTYRPDRQPACNAHRLTPPLFATLALGWLAAGRPDRALELVEERRRVAIRSASDARSMTAADRIGLELTCRLRLREGMPTGGLIIIEESDDPVLGLALAAAALVGSPEISVPEQDAPLHLWWRTRTILRPERDQELLRRARDRLPSGPVASDESFDSASLYLDRVELELLTGEPRAAQSDGIDPHAWLRAHPFRTEEAIRLALRADALGVTRPERDRWARLAAWADTVGARWMASLAMAEGELLALRLPSHARRLLEFARQLSEQAGDRPGALFATVCGAIAEIHTGPEDEARQRIPDDIQRSYEALEPVARDSGLLSWAAVRSSALADAIRSPSGDTVAWSGWITRIVACLTWARNPANPALAEPANADVAAPAELLLSADPAAKKPDRFSQRVSAAVVTGFVAAVLIGGAQGLLSGLWHVPWWVVFAGAAAITAVAPFIVTAFPRLASHGRSLRRSRSLVRVRVLVTKAGPASSPWPAGQASIRLEHWPADIGRFTLPGILTFYSRCLALIVSRPGRWRTYGPAETEFWTGLIPAVRAYRRAGVADQISRELDTLTLPLRSRHRLPVALEVAPKVAGVPWEAFLAGTALTGPNGGRLQFYRWGPPLPTAAVPAHGHVDLAVLADERWWLMAERGWGELADRRLADASRDLPAQARISVLHVIGRVLGSASGSLLQVSSGGERMKSAGVESAVRRTGELLSPDHLPLGRADLLVIEAEPAESSMRLDSDREKTAELRRFAADCFQAGARAVLMIPALPPALAGQVLSILAADRPWRELDPHGLLPAVADIEASIRDRLGPVGADDELVEPALDVCLFARHPWPLVAGKSDRNEAS